VNAVILRHLPLGILVLALNRPQARNALNRQLINELYTVLADAAVDEAVRVVVLTGTDPAFCAGLDLKEIAQVGLTFFKTLDERNCIISVGEFPKPVIGAVNGPAFTGGLELALACDFLIASEHAVFADTHAAVGVMPAAGMTARLPAVVGGAQARRMSFTGEAIDAATALRIGLVTEVVPHTELLDRAIDSARRIAASPPIMTEQLKRVYCAGALAVMGEALASEQRIAGEYNTDWDTFEQRRLEVLARNRAALRT